MGIRRAFVNVLVDDLARARAFYVDVLGYRSTFESDWFVQVAVPGEPLLELGLLRRNGEVVPEPGRAAPPAGAMLSVVVEDVDAAIARARAAGAAVVESPRDLFYGQRRAVIRDPDGLLIDVSSECAPDPAWMKRVSRRDDGAHVEAPADDGG